MRLSFATLILVTTALSPAFAADIGTRSIVDAVTVFPQGAEVTRLAEFRLEAGEHTLILDDLPAELQPETIRVEGEGDRGIEIGSVDAKLVPVPLANGDAARKRLERDLEVLADERSALDQAITDAEYQKSLMQQLAQATMMRNPEEGETRILDAQGLGGVLDLIGGKLAAFGKIILDARIRQREIDRLSAELNTKLAELAPEGDRRMRVSVHVAAKGAAAGSLKLRYRIANAGWQPVYDARLASPDKDGEARIELVRRADVVQGTTESWQNIALTFSTARPVGATSAPDLMPMNAVAFEEGRRRNYSDRSQDKIAAEQAAPELRDDDAAQLGGAAKSASIQLQAQIEVAGFQALYGIPGRVSIDNSGSAKKVRIATDMIDAKLAARAVPRVDPNAYLTAAFTLDGETPLLPGSVMLYRDGVFMGQGYLPLLSPGEEAKLGFGADDLIKVKRIEVKRQRGEEGLLTSSQVDERAFDITVKNLHKTAIPVTVIDQMPYSELEQVRVSTLSGMTPPTVKDLERRRGVLAWSLDLEPQAAKVIKHGYKVTWPADMQIGMNME